MATKAKWMKRGTFDCSTGRWTGAPFDIDADIMERVTEFAALGEHIAVFRNDIRADNTERRITITIGLAA